MNAHLLAAEQSPTLDYAATAFVLVCASLVLLMTPALALFYGGMTRAKSVLNMLMMSLGGFAVVAVLYVLFGYSMSFGPNDIGGLFANPLDKAGLSGMADIFNSFGYEGYGNIPELAFVGFQLTFAGLTVAIISGAVADRVKFSTWLVFAGIWAAVVYFPIAHMVWGGGLLSGSGSSLAAKIFGTTDGKASFAPIDFAGGTVVHINAGMAGLVLAVVAGRRRGFGRVPMRPHNVPLTLLGAGLLWFGWFGFNAGSELAADGTAALVWVNTAAATCAALLGWLLVERINEGHATTIGAASGAVAGLVAITPACGAVSPMGALVVGLVAGGLSALAVSLKFRLNLDDSLDVVGVHLVSGLWGTIAAGLLSTTSGLFYGKGVEQTLIQIVIAAVCLAFTGIVTLIIALALKATMGWRIDEDDEVAGIDQAEHAESAYDFGGYASGSRVTQGLIPTSIPRSGHGGTIGAEHNEPTGARS
ncbi:ammonium transporter [Dermacoccus abyssi]|uniref:Ammonium transporter n=1 Tax=Dermacoccus abyssi TaxID=322596 RepID=A0ABX5ZA23_9MICO|nr:ammonium transporter [Dermacoccus abyssi]